MAAYKALENKSFHKGAYIMELIEGEHRWTTNGAIMVRETLTVNPLKSQVLADARAMPPGMREHIYRDDLYLVEDGVEDGDTYILGAAERRHVIDITYYKYLQAKYEGYYWHLSDKVVIVTESGDGSDVAAVVAPIIKKDKEN